jgi:hypothetical protein
LGTMAFDQFEIGTIIPHGVISFCMSILYYCPFLPRCKLEASCIGPQFPFPRYSVGSWLSENITQCCSWGVLLHVAHDQGSLYSGHATHMYNIMVSYNSLNLPFA